MTSYINYRKITQRKGVSQIIGSLIMLAIVVSFGSIVLFQGINGINNFNLALSVFKGEQIESVSESLIVEHVKFTSNDETVAIWVRNTGTVDVTIDVVTMVNIDTQELVLNNNGVSKEIPMKDMQKIGNFTATLSPSTATWNDSGYINGNYRISITTVRGNSFETLAKPFNT